MLNLIFNKFHLPGPHSYVTGYTEVVTPTGPILPTWFTDIKNWEFRVSVTILPPPAPFLQPPDFRTGFRVFNLLLCH